MSCAYFVSDLHLYGVEDPKVEIFTRFLHRLTVDAQSGSAEVPTRLFMVGDIFDLWVGDHTYFEEKFSTVVEAIRRCIEAGIEVHFFEGNHDLHIVEYWGRKVGVHVHRDVEYFEIAGMIVRIEHGDLINPDDTGYLFLRWFLRTKPMEILVHRLPGKVVETIGERASRASRRYTSTSKELSETRIRSLIRSYAETAYLEKPFDLLVTGHVHVVDDMAFEASGKRVRSVNLGSWFDEPRAFVLSETKSEFVRVP